MSKEVIVNRDNSNPDIFTTGGSSINTSAPDVNAGSYAGPGSLSSGSPLTSVVSPAECVYQGVVQDTGGYGDYVVVTDASAMTLKYAAYDVASAPCAYPSQITGYLDDGVPTAIRAGYWNAYTGSWDTQPTESNYSFGNDESITSLKVSYLYGSVKTTTIT